MTADDRSFEFEQGDEVLVRVREHGTSGNITAKFTATCDRITGSQLRGGSPCARLSLPFGVMNSVTLRPYEAEFEVVGE